VDSTATKPAPMTTLGNAPVPPPPVDVPEQTPGPLPPLGALRRFWVIGLLLSLLGIAAGYAVATTRPVTYTSQTSLAVGGQDLSSFQVAGFALAAQQIASNYARYIGLPQSQTTFKKVLGANASKVQSVAGSPISNSNIILVEVVATDPTVATRGSDAVAGELMREANAPVVGQAAAVYLSQFTRVAHSVYTTETAIQNSRQALALLALHKAPAPVVATQQAALAQLLTKAATLQVQQKTLSAQYQNALTNANTFSRVVVAQPGVITLVSRRATIERYGLAGLVGGAGLGLAVAVALDRASVRRRLRRRRRIAMATGSGRLSQR